MEKNGQDSAKVGRVPSTKFTQDSWNQMEGQSNKRKSTESDWIEATTRHRIGERFRFAGHIFLITPERPLAQLSAQWIGHQSMVGEEEVDQRRRCPRKQEKLAGARR